RCLSDWSSDVCSSDLFKQTVTFTATATLGALTGTVQFFDGKKSLGTSSLNNGVATLLTSSLSKGTHSIKAVYGGNANFNGSTSRSEERRVGKEGEIEG